MNREKIITELKKIAEKEHGWYSIRDCSVVGKTDANLIDYNYQKVEISPSDDVLFITLISSGWAVRTSIMEEYADLQVSVENGVLTIKGKRCELVVEKEDAVQPFFSIGDKIRFKSTGTIEKVGEISHGGRFINGVSVEDVEAL